MLEQNITTVISASETTETSNYTVEIAPNSWCYTETNYGVWYSVPEDSTLQVYYYNYTLVQTGDKSSDSSCLLATSKQTLESETLLNVPVPSSK